MHGIIMMMMDGVQTRCEAVTAAARGDSGSDGAMRGSGAAEFLGRREHMEVSPPDSRERTDGTGVSKQHPGETKLSVRALWLPRIKRQRRGNGKPTQD